MYPKVVVHPHQKLHIGIDEDKMNALFEKISDRAADIAKSEIKKGGRTGRFRDDGSVASREGEAPHTETGELVRSIKTVKNLGGVSLVSTAEYAAVHEFGKRPFLMPAVEQAIKELVHEFGGVIKVEAK